MKSRIQLARALRRNQTDPERRLWARLRNRQLNGWKFRRQVPIDRFVADFLCNDAKLIVELDGGQHSMQAAQDGQRTVLLETLGFKVVRYWNHAVMTDLENVLEDILAHLELR
ncbi:endonuclease domain-containing protein [Stappia sp. F7233]|uniref:Endonuclease domain-containing protein n=2 Tax=Stappia albiluteola TaxID=2758565 RepID=A0A839ACJ2_9HYPH|nr:endonuclease domain-containing protein [Stappia albiluteola]